MCTAAASPPTTRLFPCASTRSPTTICIRVLCSSPGISGGYLDGKTLYWTSKQFSTLHRVQSPSALRLRRCFLRSEGVADFLANGRNSTVVAAYCFACRRAHYYHVEATAIVLLLLVDFLSHPVSLRAPLGRLSSR